MLLDGLRKARRYARCFGVLKGVELMSREVVRRAPFEVSLSPNGFPAHVTLRAHSSDMRTCEQVLVDREYEIPGLRDPQWIIDAGANVGLAAVFFAEMYPRARIVALEPEATNFEMLKRNTSAYPQVTCIRAALWYKKGQLNLLDGGDGNWGFRTGEGDEGGLDTISTVPCVTRESLLAEFQIPRLDLLKIDIEGSEKEVFEASGAWIDRVEVIAVELHDRFKRGCSRAFYNATADFDAELHRGENVFVSRHPFPAS
jgi:FkbM family methyltransferase